MNKNRRKIILFCVIILAIFLIVKGLFKHKPRKEIPPKPVEAALTICQDAAVYIDSFGNLYTPNDVDIKAQVTGEIKEINFKEGTEVKKDDLLFTIDPSTYQATLDKARASLLQDLADLKLQKVTFERNKKLFEKELISQQDFDTYTADLSSASAKVRMDYAEIEIAKINLNYCYVRSPVDGLSGKRQVDLGNIVTANSGPTLVNIKTIDPLYVDFTIPEGKLSDVRESLKEGKLKVQVYFDDDPDNIHEGELELIDNAVDNNTGTVLLRANIPNKKRDLWAGQFIRVRLILRVEKDAILVPYEAVRIGQNGPYLFVIKSDNTVDLRLVKIGSHWKNYIVIEDGVKIGERVVTSGQLGLSPGAKVVELTQK